MNQLMNINSNATCLQKDRVSIELVPRFIFRLRIFMIKLTLCSLFTVAVGRTKYQAVRIEYKINGTRADKKKRCLIADSTLKYFQDIALFVYKLWPKVQVQ